MIANKAETGKKYLTKSGIPVTMLGPKGSKMLLKVETTGNKTEVDADYELRPYDETKLSKDARLLMKVSGKSKNGASKTGARDGSLAAVIDPMLFSGGHTIQEIAAELKKKAKALTNGKDLEANVRARLFTYRRKGFRVEKDAQKNIRVVKKG